jgi:lipoate-protein ligase B
VRKAIYALLEVAASVGRLYQSSIEIREGAELGVWTDHGKFAAVGIHIKNGILLHGLSVNGFKTPESFCGLRPCGLDAPIDFLISEQEQAVGLKTREELFLELKEELIAATLKRFSPNRAEPHPPL